MKRSAEQPIRDRIEDRSSLGGKSGLTSATPFFAGILGIFVGFAGLIDSRAPIIMIPLALAGLYVAAVTTARNGHVVTGFLRGILIGGLILLSATALLAVITLVSRYVPSLRIAMPPEAAFNKVWAIGGLIIGFWFLLGLMGKAFGRR